MNYSTQLIDAVKLARGLTHDTEVAEAIGVNKTAISQWKNGHGSPMPEERVLQLCELARIADPAPWLAGVHADGVKDAQAKKQWESLLDRLRPSVATAMLGVVLLGTFALPPPTNAGSLTETGYRHYAKWRKKLRRAFAAFAQGFGHGSPALLA
jgi:transcriptional regulator with XRE-family HTH domain